jgi:hypothetical protein
MESQRVPAKCAARMGQCFSTTVDAAAVGGKEHVSRLLSLLGQWGVGVGVGWGCGGIMLWATLDCCGVAGWSLIA